MKSNKATVLLVDDESMASGIIRCILKAAGYLVLSASSAQNAMEVSRRHSGAVGLMIGAFQMMGMSGGELAEQLEYERPGVRILLVSGVACDQAPGLQYPVLSKPFTTDDLLLKVAQVIGTAK